MIRVRQTQPDDWQEWRQLRLAALEESPYAFDSTLSDWSGPADIEQRWRSRLESVPRNLVGYLDDVAVGMVSITVAVDGEVDLISMWVSPVARGHGVGDALLGECVAQARRDRAVRIALDVEAGNEHAIGLYERAGFLQVGWARGVDDARPALRMVRSL